MGHDTLRTHLPRARMLNLFRCFALVTSVCLAGSAFAEQFPVPATPAPSQLPTNIAPPAAPAKTPVTETTSSERREGSNNQKDWHFIGHVEMDRGSDTKIYADDVWAYTGANKAIATGNVVFAQGNNRIT